MKLRICIVTMIPELAYHAANLAIDNATGPVSLMVAANCCKIDRTQFHPCADVYVEEYEDNEGVVPPMHNLWKAAAALGEDPGEDILVYIHDDFEIFEKGWDARVINIMGSQPKCDVIGFIGGTGVGAPDIYKTPYREIQLARHEVHSAMVDAEVHGKRTSSPMRIAVADGCALAVRRRFLDQHGGWSTWWPEANHGYDNALGCMLRRHGRDMWLLPIVSRHPSLQKQSGQHSNPYGAQRYGERFGDVYTRAHRRLYDTFRDVLPFHVSR